MFNLRRKREEYLVILDDNCQTKPDIVYPCQWGYKIIGRDKAELEQAIIEVMEGRAYTFKDGNHSSKGKFVSMSSRCEVASEEERNAIFKAFSDHTSVKMVI